MTESTKQLLDRAMSLPARARRRVAQALFDSLLPARDPFYVNRAIEMAWEAEVRRRCKELDAGEVQPIPWQLVRRDLERRIDGRTASLGSSTHHQTLRHAPSRSLRPRERTR